MSAERRLTYVDSSALVKLVVAEPESKALRRYLSRCRPLVSSALARTEVARALGNGRLEALALTSNKTGATTTVPASALVVLIGAEPHTDWLPGRITRDEHGFIVTGPDLTTTAGSPDSWAHKRPPLQMETSMPGIFAAGDVRHRSLKRVASAVGEGSIAATLVAQYLQDHPRSAERAEA